MSCIAVQNNIFHHHNRIVDDETHRGCETPEGHQVEALPERPQHDERDRDGGGDYESGNEGTAPVPQKQNENNCRQNEADNNGVAHTGNRVFDQFGLVIKRLQLHARGQGFTDEIQFGVHGGCDGHGIAVGLAKEIQQHGGFAVRGHDGIDRLNRGSHLRYISHAHGNACRCGLDHDIGNFFGSARLPADQRQHQLVIVLQQAGRIDHVVF